MIHWWRNQRVKTLLLHLHTTIFSSYKKILRDSCHTINSVTGNHKDWTRTTGTTRTILTNMSFTTNYLVPFLADNVLLLVTAFLVVLVVHHLVRSRQTPPPPAATTPGNPAKRRTYEAALAGWYIYIYILYWWLNCDGKVQVMSWLTWLVMQSGCGTHYKVSV